MHLRRALRPRQDHRRLTIATPAARPPRAAVRPDRRRPLKVAYDEELAGRVRDLLSEREAVTAKNMFGSICFLIAGNLAVCVREDELLVRLDPENADLAIQEEGVRPAEMGSRTMAFSPDGCWLASGGWMAIETHKGDAVTPPRGWEVIAERDVGRARLTLLRASSIFFRMKSRS